MKAKADLFRTLLVLPVVVLVAMAVALFGVGLRTAETQTSPSSYKVQAVYSDTFEQTHTMAPYDINDSGHVVGTWSWYNEMGSTVAFLYKGGGMIDLGTFPFGYPWGYSYANAINNSDQVVGSDGGQAFLYDSTNGLKDLGTLPGHNASWASDINNSGQVVGGSATQGNDGYSYQNQRAFLYDSTKGMKDLGTLPGHNASWASLINDSGQVVGSSVTLGDDGYSYQNQRAFLYDSTKGMKDLGTLPGDTDSRGVAMNNSGQVIGYSFTLDNDGNYQNQRAFLYDSTKGMKDLGTLGGSTPYAYGTTTSAYDINDSGQVVGSSYTASGQSHAFLYTNGVMKDLGTLGGTSSWASDINDSGQIVGGSLNSSGQSHAFLYQNEKMTDVGDRWFPDGDCIGWNLNSGTYKINKEGQILVEAWRQDGYTYRYGALILTPTSDVSPPADCQAPSAPTITSPQNNTYDTDGSFSVSGSAEAGSTVELFEGTTSKGTTKADSSSGVWSIALSGVSEGPHTYSAKAKDAAGNISSASNSVTVTVDKTAPTVSGVSPASGATNVARNTNVTGTFSEKMDPSSINKLTFKLYKCSSTTSTNCTTQVTNVGVTLSTGGLTATLDPFPSPSTTLLGSKTKYKAIVTTGAKDMAGNALDQNSSTTGNQQKVWYFTTGTT